MNILFLTMSTGFTDIETSGIYTDLMRKFRNEGHDVYIICPNERRTGKHTELNVTGKIHCLGVRTLNVTKTNIIEKGIGQLLLERQFKSALKKYFGSVRFDIILYSTPPITFNKVIKYAKAISGDRSLTYLLLKDIFPQNAVDLGMMKTSGVKGILHKMFRNKEEELYRISDYIGCMSPANVRYLLEHNPKIDPKKVEVAPNSYDIPREEFQVSSSNDLIERNKIEDIRRKYNLPVDKPIFIYGGNMGKPQGVPFIVECMKAVKDREDCHFLLVGDGTEYSLLEAFMQEFKPKSVSVFRRLPKQDYDDLAAACDVGMIFLDYRFTIPNYPSRLLPYLMSKKPILACTDPNCDTGKIAVDNGYGVWTMSNNVASFVDGVEQLLKSNRMQMGENGYNFFLNNYTTGHTYNTIIKHLK